MQTFHVELENFVNANDNENASKVILKEIAISLVRDRSNFIEVLKSSGVNVEEGLSDAQLIDLFVKNAPTNKQILIGMAYLVNHQNQTIGFDGESEVSDSGVKDSYKVMDEYFNAGGGVAEAISSIANLGSTIGGKAMDNQRNKKFGATDALAKQKDARNQMLQTIIEQRKSQSDAANKTAANKSKTIKTALIIGGSVLALAIIGVIIYKIKKK